MLSRYLSLLYLWAATGENLNAFFKHPQNVSVVTKAFEMMELAWVKYDAEKHRRLSMDELTNLITIEMPNLLGNLQGRVHEFYPEADRSVIIARPPLHCSALSSLLRISSLPMFSWFHRADSSM